MSMVFVRALHFGLAAITFAAIVVIWIVVFKPPAILTNGNASELIGCRLSLHSASGVTNELGRAESVKKGADGPSVYVEWGWFNAYGQPLASRADDKIAPAWVPATAITGYTCDGGKSWTWFK